MSLLSYYMPAAEIFIGGTFADGFEDETKVGLNGGVLFNNPTVDNGLVLDGVNQYAQYTLDANVLNSDPLSFVVEFIPDFEYDEDSVIYIYASDSFDEAILKNNNAASNTLIIYFGGSQIAAIPSATYSPYWLPNERNVIVVSGDSGDTNAYLNGNQILTADATAWTPTNQPILYIGSNNSGTGNFSGTITSLKIYHSKLSAREALNFYDDDTYDYDDHLVMDLPCTSCFGDTGNNRTRDASDNGNDGIFGDGVTPATFPTKLEFRGYGYDGLDDYLDCGDAGESLTDNFTLCAQIKTVSNNVGIISRWMTTSHYELFINGVGKLSFYEGAVVVSSTKAVNDDVVYSCASVVDSGICSIYLDGLVNGTPLSVNVTYFDAPTSIGARNNGATGRLNGEIYQASIYSIPLTAIQSADWHIEAEASIGYF